MGITCLIQFRPSKVTLIPTIGKSEYATKCTNAKWEEYTASWPMPHIDNVRPVGMVPQPNIVHAPYRPNAAIDNLGGLLSPPGEHDCPRLAGEALAQPNLRYIPQGPNVVVDNQVSPPHLSRGQSGQQEAIKSR